MTARPVEVEVAQGRLRGFAEGGVAQFRGVPFAAPPVGDRRFRAPGPAPSWGGVLDATMWGPRAPQSLAPEPFRRVVDVPLEEDCLFLNVSTPACDARERPVMVWIHGGAFTIGSGCLFDATELARRGDVVVVTINYRLGALGFSYLDHVDDSFAGSGNAALLDQIAALSWVRDNIASFGGDPATVTIFGESAGGHSVGCLLVAPGARGLFHRAIAQSGAGFVLREADQALATTAALADQLGVTEPRALQALPAERLVEAQAGFSFAPVLDGVVLPEQPLDAVAGGRVAEVPLLITHTRDEMRLFAHGGRLGTLPGTDDELAERLAPAFADPRAALAAYRAAEPGASSGELWLSYLTDVRFHLPDFALADAWSARRSDVWMARFSWPSPALGGRLGACHAIDVPLLFPGGGNLGGMTGDEGPPAALAHAVKDAWAAFARHGDPNTGSLPKWPRYDRDRRAVMQLAGVCSVIEDPDGAIRRLRGVAAPV